MSLLAIVVAAVMAFVIWSLSKGRSSAGPERQLAVAVGKETAERMIERRIAAGAADRKSAASAALRDYLKDRR